MDAAPSDIEWILIAAVLVLLMQAGFCYLETGLVRAKNSINVAVKNLLDCCLATIIFVLFGFGMAFGPSLHGLVGHWPHATEALSPVEWAALGFQLVFCNTAATIVSGAIAERVSTLSYLALTALTACAVYPICAHWAWGGLLHEDGTGWLQALGFIDFAGGTVVHVVGGTMALVAVARVGPRLGRYDGQGIEPHDLNMAVQGAFFLVIGWLGFNGGSFLRMDSEVPRAVVTTLLGGAVGAISTTIWTALRGRTPVQTVILGLLSGLVAVTPGVHLLSLEAAATLAAVGALLALWTEDWMEHLRLDDAVSAVPVHLVAGVVGTLGLALVGDEAYFGDRSRLMQLGIQSVGVLAVIAYAAVGTYIALTLVSLISPLRVSRQEEELGLNVSEHNAGTAVRTLLAAMERHRREGDFQGQVEVSDPMTEAGQIATHYNAVIDRIRSDSARMEQVLEQTRQATEAMEAAQAGQEASLVELSEWNRRAVGRELRMIELKREVNRLLAELNRTPQYADDDSHDTSVALMLPLVNDQDS